MFNRGELVFKFNPKREKIANFCQIPYNADKCQLKTFNTQRLSDLNSFYNEHIKWN